MSIFNKLINLIKSEIHHNFSFKKNPSTYQDDFTEFSFNEKSKKTSEKKFSKQLREDLELFELEPPINEPELKKKRNTIYKKYHPDVFNTDSEKKEIAKKIIQLYNDAYHRIMEVYRSKK